MAKLKKMIAEEVYKHFKCGVKTKYNEEEHCKLLINVMLDPDKGSVSAFCVDAFIIDGTFYNWVNEYELFRNIYHFSRMVAREIWEEEGRKIKDTEFQMGTMNYSFDHWKLIGWSRFGVSKNSKLKLSLNPKDSPAKHYQAILKQAGEGDFTASEFKQLMEAVNVGLNVHQIFELQEQINQLKSDLETVTANRYVENPFTDQRTKKED